MLAVVFPFIAAVAHSVDILLDRFIMTRHRLGHRQFAIVLFLGLYFWSSLSTIVLGGIDAAAFAPRYLLELAAVIAIASLYNMLYYQGIEKEHVERFEPILIFMPLAAIVAAALVFPDERNPVALPAAIIAAVAVAFPYLRRASTWDTYQWRLVWYVALAAIEALLLKDLLTVYQPASLYAVRTGLILVALFSFYRFVRPIPLVVISPRHIKEVFLLSIAPTIYFIAMLYAIQLLGIVVSTLLFLVYPLFVYAGAKLLLKEKLHWKNLVSGAVVLVCVLVALMALQS
jgi:drug/metabolite transporter (DMT)-like permease